MGKCRLLAASIPAPWSISAIFITVGQPLMTGWLPHIIHSQVQLPLRPAARPQNPWQGADPLRVRIPGRVEGPPWGGVPVKPREA